jgi:hypothetical protein
MLLDRRFRLSTKGRSGKSEAIRVFRELVVGQYRAWVRLRLDNPMAWFLETLDAACRAALRRDHRPGVAPRLDVRDPKQRYLAIGAGSPCGPGFWCWPGLLVCCSC